MREKEEGSEKGMSKACRSDSYVMQLVHGIAKDHGTSNNIININKSNKKQISNISNSQKTIV